MINSRKVGLTIFFLSILACFAGQFASAQAQPEVRLSTVDVSLFPELNRPSMLVVKEIEIDVSTDLPQAVNFKIPKDAQLQAVYARAQDNSVSELAHEVTQLGDWNEIRFTATTAKIRIEYYDPKLIKQCDKRIFTFEWLSNYPVDLIAITIRQPFGASDLTTEPDLGKKITAAEGYDYYSADLGSVPAGSVFSLTLRYIKNTENAAYPALKVEPAAPIHETTPGRTPPPLSVVWWLLMVAGTLLLLVGIYYWWFRVNVFKKTDRLGQGVGILNPEKQAIFCHECGMRSKPGDSFCSNCGTELRKATDFDQPHNL